MPLPTSSLAKICDSVREHVATLGQNPSPTDWDVRVAIGAPGANLASSSTRNTLNLFFYRFEPFGFSPAAQPGDIFRIKVFCVITAFGIDEDVDNNNEVDFSAGFNELRMLSQVMRLFQETPVLLMEGDDAGELWHIQFIPRPLADEQINQIWSTQGDTVYRPSVVYELALAPIEPENPTPQATRVSAIGAVADSRMSVAKNMSWPADRDLVFPAVPSMSVDTANTQWAPALLILTGAGSDRQAHLSLHLEVPLQMGGDADFSAFPELELLLIGDTTQSNDLKLVGQLLQNPDPDQSSGRWQEIDVIENLTADTQAIDNANLPAATAFSLQQAHWTNIDNSQNNWQLQIFAERCIRFNTISGEWENVAVDAANVVRIRSNPVLVTLTREATP